MVARSDALTIALFLHLTRDGQHSLGWGDAGEIATGMRADLTTIALDSVRTVGCAVDQAMLAATASDVHSVVVDGRVIVADGEHMLGDVASLFGF